MDNGHMPHKIWAYAIQDLDRCHTRWVKIESTVDLNQNKTTLFCVWQKLQLNLIFVFSNFVFHQIVQIVLDQPICDKYSEWLQLSHIYESESNGKATQVEMSCYRSQCHICHICHICLATEVNVMYFYTQRADSMQVRRKKVNMKL